MSYYMLSGLGRFAMKGFGAIDFNASTVWSDWLAGASGNAAAGKRAASNIQAALNQLGYGPIGVDGAFGSGSLAAWARFANDNGTGDAKWPTQVGIDKMGEVVAAGGAPGGGPVVESHIVNGQFVPGPAPGAAPIGTPAAKAGMTGTQIGLLVAALVVVGGLAVMAKKKKPGAAASSGYGGSSAMTVHATPNRRRRRHHASA